MNDASQERLARNEAFFRDVNERIRELAERFEGDEHEFLCECADVSCRERLSLTLAQYERVRADGTRFIVAPGHARPAIEQVVEHGSDYLVVEKRARAADVADGLDPRPEDDPG